LLEAVVNNDLADNFRDLWPIGRSPSLPHGSREPFQREEAEAERQLERELKQHLNALGRHHASSSLRKATDEVRAIWRLANGYLAGQAPWVTFRTDPNRCRVAVRTAVNLVEVCATVAWPFIPNAAETVLQALGRAPA
jgi:methionyl-tRNA synthetase